RCLELLEERGVLVFPRIDLSDAQQLAFTDRLGTRVNYTRSVPGGTAAEADVYKITLDPQINNQPEYVQGTFFWHMDGLNSDIPPPKATVLSGRRIARRGGQTEFASTYLAYESLPEEEKAEMSGLRVVHSLMSSMRRVVDDPTEEDLQRWSQPPIKEHPLVWNRRSGRKSLIIGSSADHVVGMPLPDGRALLARLVEWAAQPDFHYKHDWQEGDLVIWDNTGTLHRVRPYQRDSGRTMHRTTIAGDEAVN
ncbi:MAG TPA: TauD/TfdA family dioxygenase, partial [Steroidobacteraceae bacterium]|nr:TauD/TfdA family dioxygenase [Steroidobacteraceae bacterium]